MNKFIKLSVFSSVLCAQAANFGCGGGGESPDEPVLYDTPAIREKMTPLFADILFEIMPEDVKQTMEKEFAAIEKKYKDINTDMDEESRNKLIAKAEKDSADLYKKYMHIPADFFETVSPFSVISVFINKGAETIALLTPEELAFWYYVERMRCLMFASLHRDLNFGEGGWLVEEFTEAVKANLNGGDIKILADVFENVIRYEKQKPFNFKKRKEDSQKNFPEGDSPLSKISEEDFAKSRQKIIELFESELNIMRNLKPGQSFEEAVAEENAKNGIVEYELGLTMHPLYPIKPFFTVLNLDEEGKRTAEVFQRPDKVWGYPAGGSSHISSNGARPLPRRLDMVYYSVIEGKAYSLEEPLPYEKLKEMFSKKDEAGHPLYTNIIIGAAPYGGVALWTQRGDTRQTELITWLKGKEVALDFADFASSALISGSNWDEFRANSLQKYKEAAEHLKENGLPDKELFDWFNEKYNTAFNVKFNAPAKEGENTEDMRVTSFEVKYFNGESESVSPEDFGKAVMRAKPKEIKINFKDANNENSAYLYVPYKTAADNIDTRLAYQSVFAGSPQAEGELSFVFNGISKPWDIKISACGKEAKVDFEEIRFRNKFEVYRTPVYYQPHSFWKGRKPEPEAAEISFSKEEADALDSNGDTLLIKAVRGNSEETFKALLAAGADVNLRSKSGETALAEAAAGGNVDFVKALLKAGADPNTPGIGGKTPLMEACVAGDEEIAKLLLQAGADVNAPWLVNGLDAGANALSLALENGFTDLAEFLRGNGAAEPVVSAPVVESAPMPSAENINTPDAAGFTPLFHALIAGDNVRLKALIEAGADVNIKAPAVGSPLLFACTSSNAEAAKALIDAKADLNAVGDTGYTPLMMSCQIGNKELVSLLLQAGADVSVPHIMNGQNTGLNALKIAQDGGFEDIAALLKDAGAE